MKVIPITIFVVHLLLVSAQSDGPVVCTKNGLLRGMNMQTKKGRKFQGFVGIRYAQPPVGPLRFKPSVPMNDWDGIKDATKDHAICIQINTFITPDLMDGVEDCLFLNVYTPKINSTDLLPVIVFIHGGAFHFGTGSRRLYNPDTLLNKDIVFVTLNYRLGALGFFTTGDEVVPGNNGMKDQHLALKWVNKNIKNFGGDPNSVTLYGQSDGGSSAHLHMLSRLSKGLFHAAISEGGTALARWSLQSLQQGVKMSKRLAMLFNCQLSSSYEMINCLRNVDARDIVAKSLTFLEWDIEPTILFRPVVERNHPGAFISDTPENIIQNCLGSDVPWIVGRNSDGGAMRSSTILSNPRLLKEFNEKIPEIGHVVLTMDKSKNTVAVTKKLLTYYFGNCEINATNGRSLTDLYTDAYFSVDAENAVSLHKQYNTQPVYHYLFEYRGSMSYTAVLGGGDTDFGVCHCDDLFYFFPLYEVLFPTKRPTKTDMKMDELLTTLWTNFATYKDPTLKGVPTKWMPVTSRANEYLHIKQDQSLSMEKSMSKERMAFWKTLEPLLKIELKPKYEL